MSVIFILTVLIVIFALAFDFINGFHDTANSIATSVSTKALKTTPCHLISSNNEFCWGNDIYWCGKNNF